MVQIDAAARSIGALALVVGLSLAVPASAQGELIVPGDRVIDHRPYHIGVDLRFAVGEAVVLPWEATSLIFVIHRFWNSFLSPVRVRWRRPA